MEYIKIQLWVDSSATLKDTLHFPQILDISGICRKYPHHSCCPSAPANLDPQGYISHIQIMYYKTLDLAIYSVIFCLGIKYF